MLSSSPYIAVEISRIDETRLRVVFSRSDRPAQQVKDFIFDPADAGRVAAELTAVIDDAAAGQYREDGAEKVSRLASRLAEIILPPEISRHLAVNLLPVEFVLDDYSMAFPVEALPGPDGPLALGAPILRRWLCDVFPAERPQRSGVTEMLIVADPAGTHPAARREGQSVLRFMRSANPDWRIRYLSRNVGAADLQGEIPDTDIFHLAGHMEADPPGVRMADGLWLPNPNGASPGIVVAACCRAGGLTGGGRELAGRFLRSGTRQVVAPTAAVADRLAENFSTVLYRELASGVGLAQAVLAARRALGTPGLTFVHYGTLSERVELPMAGRNAAERKRRLPLAAAIAVIAVLVGLAAWRLFAVDAAEGENALPTSTSVAATALTQEDGEKISVSETTLEEAVPSADESETKAASLRRTARRETTGRPRASDKMLENF